MRKKTYISGWILGMILSTISFTTCEFDEPFPAPSADFTVWGINPVTNAYEQIAEPLILNTSISYDFKVDGTGQQFVFWFGTPGDTAKSTPTGSDFNDRGVNHYSKGKVALNNLAKFTYSTEGSYEIVLVASSYSYSEDKYQESLARKTIDVVASGK